MADEDGLFSENGDEHEDCQPDPSDCDGGCDECDLTDVDEDEIVRPTPKGIIAFALSDFLEEVEVSERDELIDIVMEKLHQQAMRITEPGETPIMVFFGGAWQFASGQSTTRKTINGN